MFQQGSFKYLMRYDTLSNSMKDCYTPFADKDTERAKVRGHGEVSTCQTAEAPSIKVCVVSTGTQSWSHLYTPSPDSFLSDKAPSFNQKLKP